MPWHPTLINSEILSIHAALLPVGSKGKVLMVGGDEHNPAQGGTDDTPPVEANINRTALYDVDSKTVVRTSSPTTDVFCSGHAFLGDGRLLIAGGTESWGGTPAGGPGGGHVHDHGNFGGHQGCWIYNYAQNNWVRAADMNFKTGPGEGGGRWYPTVLSLPGGDLAVFGGHPSRRSNNWHQNVIPERYSPAGNSWSWFAGLTDFDPTNALPGTWYPRTTLIRGGWIFITTRIADRCRFFNPATGNLDGPEILPPPAPYNSGWNYSVILLPLVPGDNYRARVLAVNGNDPALIELNLEPGAPTPAWQPQIGARQGSAAGKARNFSVPAYLPTGQICVSGGINGSNDTDAVKEPEIYTPGIDWAARTYTGLGSWQTVAEPAQVARNYHSVALLLPDGSVFTAGSSKNAASGDPAVVGERTVEIFQPAYFSNPARPALANAPRTLCYQQTEFTLSAGTTAQAASIRKVALVRCGSATHAADFDQRYVALAFQHVVGTANLRATYPADPTVLPPGYYLLWIVDQNNLPCQLAKFVRVAHQSCTVITDRSTFSNEEVQALGGGGAATFENAVYVEFDGFIHTELTGTPSFTARWADTNAVIPAADFTLVSAGRLQEVNPGFADIPQRITFPFHVRFPDADIFATFPDTRQIRLTFTLGQLTATQTLDLTHSPNPYMIDIKQPENNPAWLSTDVRVFSIMAGQQQFGDVTQGMANPIPFIRQCLDKLNDPARNGSALFETLSTAASLDLATSGPWPLSLPIYNYAIARVRYRAVTTTAQRVRNFFRLFNVAATGLEFDATNTYRRTAVGPDTRPLLGTAGGEIVSIPFFASDRVETVQGRPGATAMTAQVLDPAYEIKDIAPNPGGAEVTVFFGCWLDINQTRARFPISPGGSDGPWPSASCRSVQELSRGRHLCMVSEVFFEQDLTANGATPGSSDNLAQRNLAVLHSDNPGGPDSHTVMHTFEIKPSTLPAFDPKGNDKPGLVGDANLAVLARRSRLDELLFRWHNLPPASEVTVYFSDIDTAMIQALAAARRSPLACEVVNKHTLKFKVAGATWIPIPGGRSLNIPALLSIKLPDTVTYGQEFRVSIHQVAGGTGRIVGSCEFRIPVSKAELILDEEVRTLSVFKHIITTIPADNRWYPLMQRYVHHLGLKVDALGGDARNTLPNPDGSGRPYDPRGGQAGETPTGDKPGAWRESFTGLVHEILYDCHGRFIGFGLESCETVRLFKGCEASLEQLVIRACRERLQITVFTVGHDIRRIAVHCC